MDNKIKELLEKQLELLSEQSKSSVNINILPELTKSMCDISKILLEYRGV